MKKTSKPFKIILAQINIESKKIVENFMRIENAVQTAINQNGSLIIFPEMCVSGYLIGDLWECSSFLKECEEIHDKIIKLSQKIHIIFGSVGVDWAKKNEDGRVRKYNAAFFAQKGKLVKNKKTKLPFWPKTLLPQYREFDDGRYFYDLRKLAYDMECRIEDLYEPIIFAHDNQKIKCGITICEDVWDENYTISPVLLFGKKYKHDFFINISASPFTLGKNEKRDVVFERHAQALKVPFLYANCFGSQNIGKTIFLFDGSSKVYGKNGEPLAEGNFCADDHVCVEYHPRKKHLSSAEVLTKQSRESEESILQNVLETTVKLVCQKWNISKVVIGVSGGIDSALTSVIFSRVLGCQNVYLINMPTEFNSEITRNAAKKLAKNLNCPYAIFPIGNFAHLKKEGLKSLVFKDSLQKTHLQLNDFQFENIQARERGGGVLAAAASALQAVFSCNANKSEIVVGYSTLYGDLAGFLCPIGDLWKHQVYALAKYYNEKVFKQKIIPEEIFHLPPSAELSNAQDVTKGLGDPLIYEYHDRLFAVWVEAWERKTNIDCLEAYKNKTIDKILQLPVGKTKKLFPTFTDFAKDLNLWWEKFQQMGAIKRMQAPPIIAVSRRSFGLDYRESI